MTIAARRWVKKRFDAGGFVGKRGKMPGLSRITWHKNGGEYKRPLGGRHFANYWRTEPLGAQEETGLASC